MKKELMQPNVLYIASHVEKLDKYIQQRFGKEHEIKCCNEESRDNSETCRI